MRSVKYLFIIGGLAGIFLVYTNATSNQLVNGNYVFDYDLETTYGESSDSMVPLLQEAMDAALKQNCFGEGPRQGPTPYKCGEYPFGSPFNATYKLLDDFSVEFPSGKVLVKYDEGSIYLKNNFNMRIFMDRVQKQNGTEAALLDTKGKTRLVVQDGLFETVTLRHNPKGRVLYSMACTYFPGVNISTRASDFNIRMTYHWSFLFFSNTEKASTYTEVGDGKFSIDNAKVCAILKTEIIDLKPVVTVMDISYPEVNDLKITAPLAYDTRVVFETWGLKIVSFILKFFGIMDMEKMIAQQIEKQMQKQFDGQIKVVANGLKTGSIFETMFSESVNEKFTRNIALAYKKVLAKQVDDRPIHIEEDLTDVCEYAINQQARSEGLPLSPQGVRTFCEDTYVAMNVVPFEVASKYKDKGCYDYAFSPLAYSATGKNGWWRNSCAVASKVSLTVKPPRYSVVVCLDKVKWDPAQPQVLPDVNAATSCMPQVQAAYLGVSTDFIAEVKSLGLTNASQIQQLATKRGISATVIQQMLQKLK